MNNPIKVIDKQYLDLPMQIKVYEEFEPVDVAFGDDKLDAEYIARFESGELINVIIIVDVLSKSGLVKGSDILGACHIRADHFEEDVNNTVLEHDMGKQAYDELLVALASIKTNDLN